MNPMICLGSTRYLKGNVLKLPIRFQTAIKLAFCFKD
jgi:hypothetical protein